MEGLRIRINYYIHAYIERGKDSSAWYPQRCCCRAPVLGLWVWITAGMKQKLGECLATSSGGTRGRNGRMPRYVPAAKSTNFQKLKKTLPAENFMDVSSVQKTLIWDTRSLLQDPEKAREGLLKRHGPEPNLGSRHTV